MGISVTEIDKVSERESTTDTPRRRCHEHVTLLCENPRCPRPNRQFEVPKSACHQRFCGRACAQEATTAARAALAQASPEMTADEFAMYSERRLVSPGWQDKARQVLVDGRLMADVIRETACCQRYLSLTVRKYRHAKQSEPAGE